MAPFANGRRPIMGVIGAGSISSLATERLCVQLGKAAIDAGFRLATGGLGGVMSAVCHGARDGVHYREGDVLGILPSYDSASANTCVDIAIPTGLGIARNVVLVSTADVVVAIGGGSGTLSEMALAWQLGKPIVALVGAGGWAARLAGAGIDERRADRIVRCESAEEAVAQAAALLEPQQEG